MANNPKRYFTGRPCPQGHIDERFVSSRCCVECASARALAYKHSHPEKAAALRRRWARENPERNAAIKSAWNKAHPEGQAKRARKWALANREKVNAASRAWRERNLGKAAARQARRRCSLMKRTPPWADHEAIAVIYIECERRRAAGELVEVDHVIPLQGDKVSGLHVARNLQIIPMPVNRSKANNFGVAIAA